MSGTTGKIKKITPQSLFILSIGVTVTGYSMIRFRRKMKLFIPIAIAICILCSILCTLVYGESGCPPPENLSPCRCYYSSITYLECSNIYDDSDLRKVFKNSEGYSFRQVFE